MRPTNFTKAPVPSFSSTLRAPPQGVGLTSASGLQSGARAKSSEIKPKRHNNVRTLSRRESSDNFSPRLFSPCRVAHQKRVQIPRSSRFQHRETSGSIGGGGEVSPTLAASGSSGLGAPADILDAPFAGWPDATGHRRCCRRPRTPSKIAGGPLLFELLHVQVALSDRRMRVFHLVVFAGPAKRMERPIRLTYSSRRHLRQAACSSLQRRQVTVRLTAIWPRLRLAFSRPTAALATTPRRRRTSAFGERQPSQRHGIG